jgi:phosphomannomutase
VTHAPDAELLQRARVWKLSDPDPVTQSELDALIARGDGDELAECLGPELDFGTAGLRGRVGPGPARMNRAVVIRAARALAEHFLDKNPSLPWVVIGYDARSTSRTLAEAVAGVFVAAGFRVSWFPAPVPTPLVAYAARVGGASGAVVITASHNPREDNGLKAYDGAALQLGSPADADVARRRNALPGARSIPCTPFEEAGPALSVLGPEIEARYLDELSSSLPPPETESKSETEIRIAYTPLHGVGLRLLRRALALGSPHQLEVGAEQADPDGAFPTTPKPNPEEPGTLDRVLDLAQRIRADLVIANDPDADRLAAAVPTDPDARARVLTGNELGVLLADFVLAQAPREPRPLLVTSVVSTPLLERIAAEHGSRFERTLTGFKWIWYAARSLEAEENLRFAFGCEEALGYSIGHLVRDKDGIAAAVWLAELAARCKADGHTLLDRLDAIHRRHGAWASAQRSLSRPGQRGAAAIRSMVERLGQAPPDSLATLRCSAFIDYRQGASSRRPWLAETPLFELQFEGASRLLVRPSGTEPKLKIYADCSEPVSAQAPALAVERAKIRALALADEMTTWLEDS